MTETIRNTDLCALMDGECDPARRARLEAALLRAPACAERLGVWRRNDAALRLVLLARTPGPFLHAAARPGPSPPFQAPPFQASHAQAAPAQQRPAAPPACGAHGLALIVFSGGAACGALAVALILLS